MIINHQIIQKAKLKTYHYKQNYQTKTITHINHKNHEHLTLSPILAIKIINISQLGYVLNPQNDTQNIPNN